MSKLRPRLNYANVVATIALFAALSGVAVAAGLPKNSVGPNQIKRGAVNAAKIKRGAVNSAKLAAKSVTAGKLAPNAVTPGNIGNGAIGTSKLAAGAVIASTIKNGVITTNKLANANVTTQKLADGAVTNVKIANDTLTQAKLSPEFGPILSTLKSGQTLRGVFDIGDYAGAKEGETTRSAVSFSSPLLATANLTVVEKGKTTANCPGLGGGNTTPTAVAGNVCVYITEAENLADAEGLVGDPKLNNRLGFGLVAKAKEKEKAFSAQGVWAVTAP